MNDDSAGRKTRWHQAVRAWLVAFHPAHFPWWRFLLALAIGSVGGVIFASLELPLPWMLGPMVICTIAAILKAPVAAPDAVRPPMSMVIGVLLGAGFRPEILASLADWIVTLAGLLVFCFIAGAAGLFYFRRFVKTDMVTAFFAGMPGGLLEMTMIGEARGGDGRMIALVHSARILLVVLMLPFVLRFVFDVEVGSRQSPGDSILTTPFATEAWLIGSAVVGAILGHVLRLPAKFLVGPMLVSAAVHLSGASDFQPPREVVIGAQIVLGTLIGCRFAGSAPREILRILMLSLGFSIILLTLTGIFALVMPHLTDAPTIAILLAYSPGGLAEMSLVAIALNIEVAFVAAHHIARVVIVMLAADPVFALLSKRRGGPPPAGPGAPSSAPGSGHGT